MPKGRCCRGATTGQLSGEQVLPATVRGAWVLGSDSSVPGSLQSGTSATRFLACCHWHPPGLARLFRFGPRCSLFTPPPPDFVLVPHLTFAASPGWRQGTTRTYRAGLLGAVSGRNLASAIPSGGPRCVRSRPAVRGRSHPFRSVLPVIPAIPNLMAPTAKGVDRCRGRAWSGGCWTCLRRPFGIAAPWSGTRWIFMEAAGDPGRRTDLVPGDGFLSPVNEWRESGE